MFSAAAALLLGCSAAGGQDPGGAGLSDRDALSQALVDCLNDSGWDTKLGPDGSLKSTVPGQQQDSYQDDIESCQQLIGWPKTPDSPPSPEQLTELYALEVETAECIAGFGYTFDIPTLQTYLDLYHSGNPWTAYAVNAPYSESEYVKLLDACPQAASKMDP